MICIVYTNLCYIKNVANKFYCMGVKVGFLLERTRKTIVKHFVVVVSQRMYPIIGFDSFKYTTGLLYLSMIDDISPNCSQHVERLSFKRMPKQFLSMDVYSRSKEAL